MLYPVTMAKIGSCLCWPGRKYLHTLNGSPSPCYCEPTLPEMAKGALWMEDRFIDRGDYVEDLQPPPELPEFCEGVLFVDYDSESPLGLESATAVW